MNRMTAEQFRALAGVAKRPPMLAANGRPVRGAANLPPRTLPRHFTCELPFLPPTTNNLFLTLKTGVRVRSGKYKKFVADCAKLIHGQLDPDARYSLTIQVTTSLYTKAGVLRKFDASNRIKAIEDVLADRLGVDDRQFFDVLVRKRDGGEDKTVVVITELPQVAG